MRDAHILAFALILDSTGKLVVEYVYDAWGNHAVLDANGNDITSATHIGNLNPYRYRGYYYDTETGLYYLQSRYYDPEICRFMTIDGIEYVDLQDPLHGRNLYAYCGNNPVMNVDPSGHVFISILIAGIFVGAVCGGALNGVIAYQNGARGKALFGSILGGAIMGGAMGAVLAIGGAAGLASAGIAIKGFSMTASTAFALSSLIGIGAGMASYSAEALITNSWNPDEFVKSGLNGWIKGMTTFGSAFLGGNIGVFDNYLIMQGGQMFASATRNFLSAKSFNIFAPLITGFSNIFGADLTKMVLGSGIAAALRWMIDLFI